MRVVRLSIGAAALVALLAGPAPAASVTEAPVPFPEHLPPEEVELERELMPSIVVMEAELEGLESYGGLWLSWEPFRVNVAHVGQDDVAAIEDLVEAFPRPDLVDLHEVRWTYAELVAAQDIITQVLLMADSDHQIASVALEVQTNRLVVTVTSEEAVEGVRQALLDIDERFAPTDEGGMVDVEVGPPLTVDAPDVPAPLPAPEEPPAPAPVEPQFTG